MTLPLTNDLGTAVLQDPSSSFSLPPKPNLTPPSSEHTPLRLAEKHYKNRSLIKSRLTPSLRGSPELPEAQDKSIAGPSSFRRRSVVDLSRPENEEDDEVYQAGWWSPENDAVEAYLAENGGQMGEVKRWLRTWRKGKARNLGERPGDGGEGFKKVRVGDKWGYVVAEGKSPIYMSMPAVNLHPLYGIRWSASADGKAVSSSRDTCPHPPNCPSPGPPYPPTPAKPTPSRSTPTTTPLPTSSPCTHPTAQTSSRHCSNPSHPRNRKPYVRHRRRRIWRVEKR